MVLCTAPLGILIVYQLLKPALRWNFDTELGAPIRLSWMAVLLVVILLLFLSRGLMRMKGPFQLESLTTGLFLLILGWSTVVVQKVGDGDLSSVFGLGWFEAGQYAADVGIRNAISDWNSSANPDGDFLFEEIPALWLRSAEMIGLGSAFDKTWGRTDRRFNHRMNLHPPVYALTLSLWLRFFGQSRQAAIVYELVIKCLLVMLVVAWTKELLPVDQQNAGIARADFGNVALGHDRGFATRGECFEDNREIPAVRSDAVDRGATHAVQRFEDDVFMGVEKAAQDIGVG